jgi:UDP-N-acetylmuramyl pentapeptide phosphotransferase/UDP-N-acetylglucosamine-1-phosphate transferase
LGAVTAFLIFNWEPSKIFMGDTGALLIGMMLSILTIHFIQANDALPETSLVKFEANISTALSIIIIPVVDTTRIIIIRLARGISPLSADKRHIHHCLIRLGLQHSQSVLLLMAVYSLFILIAVVFRNYGDEYVLPLITMLAVLLSLILDRLMLKKIN